MKNKRPSLLPIPLVLVSILTLTGLVVAQTNGNGAAKPTAPMAEKKPKSTKIHGVTLVDDYFWLREKSNPQVIEYLRTEDSYTEAVMKPTATQQEKLYKEMLSHIKQTDVNVPYRYGDYFYYSRTEEGKQYPIYCRKKGGVEAKEEVMLDQNELAKGFKFMSIGAMNVSDDGNLLIFSTDNTGYRQYVLQVKDLRTGQIFPERIERVTSTAWSTDNKNFFYVTEDPVTKQATRCIDTRLEATSRIFCMKKRTSCLTSESGVPAIRL